MRMTIYVQAVGGQALPFMVRMLVNKIAERGARVDLRETHGMAQRGGIVQALIEVRTTTASPCPPKAVLIGLELLEGLRGLSLLGAGDHAAWQPRKEHMRPAAG